MARVKIDSKEVDFQNREDYRVRKKTRRMSRRMQNGKRISYNEGLVY